MGFENYFDRINVFKREKPREEGPMLSEKQKEFLDGEVASMHVDALQPEDYANVYTPEFIQKCNDAVAQLKRTYAASDRSHDIRDQIYEKEGLPAEHRKISGYLEALFYQKLGGPKGWIPNAIVWKTSEYDDYIKHTDFVIEAGNREFALSTDITFSSGKSLQDKLSRIRDNIEKGRLTEVTFYQAENGKPAIMPKIVISIDEQHALKALRLWADGQDSVLDNHPIKAKMLLELNAQLKAFASYAEKLKRWEVASAYNSALSQVQSMIEGHKDTIDKYGEQIESDLGYQAVMSFCENLKRAA